MRNIMLFAFVSLSVIACKKKAPEAAPVVEEAPVAAPMDPATTAVVNIKAVGDDTSASIICKKGAVRQQVDIVNGAATFTGVTEDCTVTLNPSSKSFTGVSGGTSLNCISADAGLNCKN